MATRQVVTQLNPDYAKQQYIGSLSPEQAECLSQGHSWPRIRPGRSLPKGVEAVPHKMGVFQVRETCPVCKTIRTWTTLPGGMFDMDVQYRYEHPKNWVTQETGTGATRRDIKASVWEDYGTAIAASTTEVPQARFTGTES